MRSPAVHRAGANLLRLFAFLTVLVLPAAALAQTTFDVIGPHEYELPVGFKPFNVFVQYAYVQRDSRVFDSSGDRHDGNSAQRIVGLSKYVHFWSPESAPNIGLAWEYIQPEIGIRNSKAADPDDRQVSGFGDPITGAAIWYKPSENSTFGFQTFVQVPVGDEDVSDTNWKNLSSFLWYVKFGESLGWTADAGAVFQGRKTDGTRPGITWHTNHRLGWRVNSWFEPFLAADYEHTSARDGLPRSYGLDGGLGVMFHTYDNQSIALRYSQGLRGENRAVNNSLNLKYVYAW